MQLPTGYLRFNMSTAEFIFLPSLFLLQCSFSLNLQSPPTQSSKPETRNHVLLCHSPHLPNADKSCRFYQPPKHPLSTSSPFSSNSTAASPGHHCVFPGPLQQLLVSSLFVSPISEHFPYSKGNIILTLTSDHASNPVLKTLLQHNGYGTQSSS